MVLARTVFYFALTAGMVLLAVLAHGSSPRKASGLVSAAIVLAACCLLSNASHWFVHNPYNQFYPIMDTLVAVIFSLAWRDSPSTWKIVLVGLILADCFIHVEFFMRGDRGFRSKYNYDLMLNLIYIAQTACVSITSAWLLWGKKLTVRSA